MNGSNDSNNPWYMSEPSVFVSRPLKKFFIGNWGFFILNSYYYNFFPKFYYMKNKYFTELGFSFAGYMFEIQNNKIEKIQKD